jgi:hypothetical protein
MINNGRAQVIDSFNELKIDIPSKKNWFILLFGIVWMGGWYMGFKSAIGSFGLDEKGNSIFDGFMTFWLLGWTIGGAFVVFMLFWGFFGREIILIDSQYFILEKSIFGIGQKRRLILNDVKNIRFDRVDTNLLSNKNKWSIWGLGPGPIKLDYGLRTYSFGLAVDEAEANYLIEIICKKTKK